MAHSSVRIKSLYSHKFSEVVEISLLRSGFIWLASIDKPIVSSNYPPPAVPASKVEKRRVDILEIRLIDASFTGVLLVVTLKSPANTDFGVGLTFSRGSVKWPIRIPTVQKITK